jgi:hypothetical protein
LNSPLVRANPITSNESIYKIRGPVIAARFYNYQVFLHMTILHKTLLKISLLLICITGIKVSYSQTVIYLDSAVVPGTTVVIAGNHYKRSGYHNMWWGTHYRKEWSTPVRVNNFYLDTAKGGLTVIQEGGSRQSRGLRLRNTAGKEYVLRSIDKDFGNGLPDIFHGTFIARIAKDQASIGYPYAATTVASLIRPTGIYHTNPQIVFVPKQAVLGKYNDKYGDQLYLIEERPDEDQSDADYFGNAKNVIGTERLYEHLYKDNDDHVDQKAFAKARLFDMFIGDWGRHADQWRWAQFKDDKQTIYRPIPRDRDQAYTTFDGFWPWFATHGAGPGTFLEDFDSHINNVKKFNQPGRPLDAQFLNELTEDQWVEVAKELQASLTDEVIEQSMRQMPAGIYEISGDKIVAGLKGRRDELQVYARRYYEYLAQHVSLFGTTKKELFEIDRLNPDETQVKIYKITKDNEVKDEPYYSRTFKRSETRDIRIYSLDGPDRFKMTGSDGVGVKIIDPDRSDSFALETKHRTKIFRGPTYEIDTLYRKNFDFGISLLLSPPEYIVFDQDPLELFTRIGVKASANFRYQPQPWRKPEYQRSHLLSFNYGFLRQAFAIGYVGWFKRAVANWDLFLKGRADLPAAENFYGVGNETVKDDNAKRTYYSTFSRRFYGGVALGKEIHRIHYVMMGLFYQSIKVNSKGDDHYLTPIINEAVFSRRHFAGVEASYRVTTVNKPIAPTKGVSFRINGGFVQNLTEKDMSFFKGGSSFSFYIPLGNAFTIASRVGGGFVLGDADYYHLNTLGGNENLRGYSRERFFGKNTLYNNNELRWMTGTKNFFYNGQIGLFAFFDTGRVWEPGEASDTWHNGYGGGVMLVPFNKVALTGTYGMSKETHQILLEAHLFF